MLKIYLARHGQDEDNVMGILNGHRDTPLTEKGREQAVFLGKEIKKTGLKFDAVFSSPLKRAFETAGITAQLSENPDPVVLPDLIERDFGIMTGQPLASIKERCYPDILQSEIITYFLNAEGAETFPDLLVRADKLLTDLYKKFEAGSLLLVSHGDFGKMIYAAFYKLPWQDVLSGFHFGNSELLLLSADSRSSDVHIFKQPQYNH